MHSGNQSYQLPVYAYAREGVYNLFKQKFPSATPWNGFIAVFDKNATPLPPGEYRLFVGSGSKGKTLIAAKTNYSTQIPYQSR